MTTQQKLPSPQPAMPNGGGGGEGDVPPIEAGGSGRGGGGEGGGGEGAEGGGA